jgi:hypothetical protein
MFDSRLCSWDWYAVLCTSTQELVKTIYSNLHAHFTAKSNGIPDTRHLSRSAPKACHDYQDATEQVILVLRFHSIRIHIRRWRSDEWTSMWLENFYLFLYKFPSIMQLFISQFRFIFTINTTCFSPKWPSSSVPLCQTFYTATSIVRSTRT